MFSPSLEVLSPRTRRFNFSAILEELWENSGLRESVFFKLLGGGGGEEEGGDLFYFLRKYSIISSLMFFLVPSAMTEGHKCGEIVWPLGPLSLLVGGGISYLAALFEVFLVLRLGLIPGVLERNPKNIEFFPLIFCVFCGSGASASHVFRLIFGFFAVFLTKMDFFLNVLFLHISRDCQSHLWWASAAIFFFQFCCFLLRVLVLASSGCEGQVEYPGNIVLLDTPLVAACVQDALREGAGGRGREEIGMEVLNAPSPSPFHESSAIGGGGGFSTQAVFSVEALSLLVLFERVLFNDLLPLSVQFLFFSSRRKEEAAVNEVVALSMFSSVLSLFVSALSACSGRGGEWGGGRGGGEAGKVLPKLKHPGGGPKGGEMRGKVGGVTTIG